MSAVDLGFEDDFWDRRDSVFINGFSVSSSLCAQKMSASAVERGSWVFLGPREMVYVNGF